MQLASSDTTGLTTPPTVVLLAGTTTARFCLIMHDDHVIDGNRSINVTASVPDWTSGSASMIDVDDDATLGVILPASTWEGQGVQQNAGTVQIGGTSTVPLVVSLASSNASELTVPASVTIPAGQTSATFSFTAVQNSLHQGPQSVVVTATATGLTSGTASIEVLDDNVDHFSIGTIASPETANVPFTVTVFAYDVLNNQILVYNGTVSLTATGQGGSLPVTPTSITFVAGVWTGSVAVDAVDPNARLHVSNGAGQTGTSGSFALPCGPLAGFQWSTIASSQTQGAPFPVTLTATDANGFPVTTFTGSGDAQRFRGCRSPNPLVPGFVFRLFPNRVDRLGAEVHDVHVRRCVRSGAGQCEPQQHMAIVDDSVDGTAFANLPAFISSGGGVIFDDWYLEDLPSVASALGATVVNTYSATMPVYDWGGSSLFTGLASPMGLEQYYYWSGQYLQPAGSGVAVAGYQSSPAADQAALIVGNSGRTILNGFLVDDVASSSVVVQLAENEIQATLDNPPVAIAPTTATFTNGVWSGSVTVFPGTSSSMFLQASDGNGDSGYSNSFTVTGLPAPLTVTVPTDATKGGPSETGTVGIPAALGFDLYVSLTSSSTADVTVPATVTIPAGQTSASFPVTIINSSSLDGVQPVTISAMAAGCSPSSGTINVYDNATADLSVSMPTSTRETAGLLTGTITASQAPAENIIVQLSSSDTTGLTVPATVVLDANTTTANFSIVMHDDQVIEGNRPITVTATADNWTSGSASLIDLDEDATLAVVLPASGWKGQTLFGAGTLQLGGTLTTNLVVPLTSSDPTLLSVPATVTIPAGQTSATFNVTLLDNYVRQGPQMVQVTATAAGFAVQNGSMTVEDSDVDHFTFDAISGAPPQACRSR